MGTRTEGTGDTGAGGGFTDGGCLPAAGGLCHCRCHDNEHVRHFTACCCPHRRVGPCPECARP